ncbi:MAG: hypothetical protein KAR19_18230 [Bacteroidales bacterium]|nr:hypothetical protein [Bacteroidales bacterium]
MGGIIYIFLRTSEHVFDGWISTIGLDNLFSLARHHSPSLSLHLPDWIIFSLPNGLWAFAYALIITSIWLGSKSRARYFWMASIPILVLGFEVLQYVGIIRGTFCIQDIAFGMAGLTLGIIVGIKIIKPDNHEKVFV